jgi:hypothetical protein
MTSAAIATMARRIAHSTAPTTGRLGRSPVGMARMMCWRSRGANSTAATPISISAAITA